MHISYTGNHRCYKHLATINGSWRGNERGTLAARGTLPDVIGNSLPAATAGELPSVT